MSHVGTYSDIETCKAAISDGNLERPCIAKLNDGTILHNTYTIDQLIDDGYANFASSTDAGIASYKITLTANCPAHSYEIQDFAEYLTNHKQYGGQTTTFIKLNVVPTCWDESDIKYITEICGKYDFVGQNVLSATSGKAWLNLNFKDTVDCLRLSMKGTNWVRYPGRHETSNNYPENLVVNFSISELPSQMFRYYGNVKHLYVNKVMNSIDAEALFEFCGNLKTGVDFVNYNYGNLWGAPYLFSFCSSIERIPLLRGTTDRETNQNKIYPSGTFNFQQAFQYCSNLVAIEPVLVFNASTSNTSSMNVYKMFQRCDKLERVYIKGLYKRNYNLYTDSTSTSKSLGIDSSLYLPNIDKVSIQYMIDNLLDNGDTTYTLTFNTTQRNKLTSAEWSALQTKAAAKHWNLVVG